MVPLPSFPDSHPYLTPLGAEGVFAGFYIVTDRTNTLEQVFGTTDRHRKEQ